MIKPCRKCGKDFEPTASWIKRNSFLCKVCQEEYRTKWRIMRRAKGLPTGGGKSKPETVEAWKKTYYSRPEIKKRLAAQQAKYRKDPLLRMRHEARWQVCNAVNSGKLKRLPCEKCGDKKTHGHHDDYYKPLEVRWLCAKHHRELHTAQRRFLSKRRAKGAKR